jgi:hypothetical protein
MSKKTKGGAKPVVEGADPGVAAEPKQAQQEEVGIRVVDKVPEGFRPVSPDEMQAMTEIGRMLELAVTKKRAVEAEIRERQMEYRGVMQEIAGIKALSDGLRNKLGTKKPGDLVQEKKTGQLFVPVQAKGKKAKKGPWSPEQGGLPQVETKVTVPGNGKKKE